MRFEDTFMFQLFWGMLLLTVFVFWAISHRRKAMQKFAQIHLLKDIAESFDLKKLKLKYFLLVVVFTLSIAALARPQWGFEWQEIKREALDIILVIDVSKSMMTKDIKPSRLERTKLAVRDLLKQLKADRVGLVGFAGDAFVLCPLTVDYNGFMLSLNELSVDSVPRGGTNIGRAIEEAIQSYDETPNEYKVVIIITDGENLEGDPLAQAKKAKDKGIKIFTVGIGTAEGELIQVQNIAGEYEFLKDANGNYVKSRLNEKLLQDIALETQGVYVRASPVDFGLDLIYEKELSKFHKREIESQMKKKYYERFQFPLAMAFILLIFETCLSTRKKIL